MRLRFPSLVCALGITVPSFAHAWAPPDQAEASGEGSAELSLSGDGADASTEANTQASTETTPEPRTRKWNPRKDQKWIKRWAPEPHMFELGVYGGLFRLNGEHELFEPNANLPMQGWLPLRRSNPDLGGRIGYYPLRFFGVEAEGGVIPGKLDDGSGAGVMPFTVRGHAVAQLGLWSVTPFVVVGAGMLGINGGGPLGRDIDPAMHFGAGAKIYLNRWVMLRLDLRDVVSHSLGVENTFVSHNFEGLLGLSITLNRKNVPPARPDEPVVIPAGPGDRDGDGILDVDDQCIDDPETVNDYLDDDGCPESDRDGDGFWDDQDTCPDEPGVEPDGCPLKDTDGDGFTDDVDSCVEEPETDNGFEDDDGCPDEVPAEVLRFSGAIKGITFETNKATIERSSLPTLDEAIRILQQYPSVRIEITGHTDDRGKYDHNMQLSRERAESVMSYLVGMGISEDRVTTQGMGPDVPIDTNDTKTGRANNRRIEFRVMTGKLQSP
ncbi:OmpA family protein [Enhygromyxa salina]|uniref:Putative lipoprotein YiaD n=1 Tax=Enhygromyxa salina TaxID=215803 RepID=A0A2S9YR03_9BACT|nr:OmpA family protein [Enhygromyxa salina]PRQ07527.1 putative lipoprotein YiaD precursor [Enhygromyxa salina]